MELRRRLIYKKFIHNRKKFSESFSTKVNSGQIASNLDQYFVLMPQELHVMQLKFLERCLDGLFPNSSIGNRWIQTVPKTFLKKRRLLPICRNKWGSKVFFIAHVRYIKIWRKNHPSHGLHLPHPKFFKRSDMNCLKQLVFRNHELLHNFWNSFELLDSFFSFLFY